MTNNSHSAVLANGLFESSSDAGNAAAQAALAGFADRSDLLREFLNAPFGKHSADLRFILDVMRSQPVAGKWFSLMTKQYSEWRAVRWSLEMPFRVLETAPESFNSREDVERWVFKQRWGNLIGSLPLQEEGDNA
ncbi:hypothetical protein RFM99_30045 [Mesorhizobium sp. VK4C]|uniref:hypothetical protein n=1 Tax=Mesorhizobium captivum TaxID=3072319 RepID=UPI002A24AB61|nr:hypothetical protein [Mesorhizobium sp. VK4C]MDX8502613.1 hypothetical protein [Mesorhizobium sp. VK4C]